MQFRLNETYLSPALIYMEWVFENTAVVFLSRTIELSHFEKAQLVSEEAYFHAMTEISIILKMHWIGISFIELLKYYCTPVIWFFFILATFVEGFFFILTVHVLGFL